MTSTPADPNPDAKAKVKLDYADLARRLTCVFCKHEIHGDYCEEPVCGCSASENTNDGFEIR